MAVLSEPIAVAKMPAMSKPAQTHRHFVENEMAEYLVRRFRQSRIGMGLIVGPEQDPDAEKGEDDRDVGEPGRMRERRLRRTSGAVNIRCTMS